MLGVTVPDQKCYFCGADVRENTAFCYNCGKPLAKEQPVDEELAPIPMPLSDQPDKPTDPVLAELAEKLDREREANEQLAKAAAERKRSRSERKKKRTAVWASPEEERPLLAILIASLVFVIALTVFILAVWVK